MADYEALKAKVQELAERDWDVPAIEARMKRLSQDGIPRKKLDPKEILANKEQILDRVQRRAENTTFLRVTRQEGGHVFRRVCRQDTPHQSQQQNIKRRTVIGGIRIRVYPDC